MIGSRCHNRNHKDHDEDHDDDDDDQQEHYHDNHDVQWSCLQSIVRHSEADRWQILSIVGSPPTLHCVTGITSTSYPHYNAICSRSGLGRSGGVGEGLVVG